MKITILSVVVILFLGIGASAEAQFSNPIPLSGHAWSSNIGWISFSGPGYEVEIEPDGDLVGHAWSSNIGWIKFGGLSGFPGGGGNATINFSNNSISGWARACAGTGPGNCANMSNHSDGWDGWISLSCRNISRCGTSNYAGTASGGVFTGYAWGSDVIGWIRWSGSNYAVRYTPPCSPGLQCLSDLSGYEQTDQWCRVVNTTSCTPQICDTGNPGSCVADNPTGTITTAPPAVRTGGTTDITWTSNNALSCTVEQQNAAGNAYQTWTGLSGSGVSSNPINRFTIFSLQCTSSGDPALETEIASTTIQIIPNQVET